ncbi:MAG: extracellular solute-binding protein [Clostridia bacterium]|nr:extracellular solute-binding protein [Clostridia bacterium]
MKKVKRALAYSLAAVFCLMAFNGCSEKKDASEKLEAGSILDHKITDEPLVLTYFASMPGSYDEENNIFKAAFEHTNVMLKYAISENAGDMSQQLAVAVSSKDMADVIYQSSRSNFVSYGNQGAFIPLNDLIDKYAPNIKKYLDENEDVRKYITAGDGNIYYIPNILDGRTSSGWFIRQDWLDKLGLKAPETIDELHDVLVAFKNNDPNGNGKADEVPLFGTGTPVRFAINEFIGIFDAEMGFRYENGKAIYGPTTENFKTAIKTLAKWYQEGLIDSEIFTRQNTREYFLGNDLGGCTHNWFGSTAGYNTMYANSVPGLKFLAMAPPAGYDGIKREKNARSKSLQEGWAISATNEHPEETMKYFDYWWTEEGRRAANFGVEGKTYNMVDGKPEYTDFVLKNEELVPADAIRTTGAQTNFGYWQDWNYEAGYLNQIALDGMNLYINGGYLPEEIVMVVYTDEEEKRVSTLSAQITTCLEETVQKWILGNESVDAGFDAFVENLNKLGLEEYTAIEQAAYERYLK